MIKINLLESREEIQKGKNIYDMKLRVVYYARVSTEKDEQLNSLENQKNYFEEIIFENKNWILVGSYIDEGISGTSVKKRESFQKMINDGVNGNFDMIMTKEVSRFARNTIDSIKYTEYLLKNGVIVNFINDNINTISPDSEFRLTLMSSLAQDEVRKLSERVKFGFKRSIKDGKVLGGGNIIGYDKKNGKLIINENEAGMIKILFDLYVSDRYSFNKISKILYEKGYKNRNGNMFSERVLSRMITNIKYKGYYCGNKSYIEDYKSHKKIMKDKKDWIIYKDKNIPPIVSEEIFDKANEIYNKKRIISKRNYYNDSNPFVGKLVCKYHNINYTRVSSGKRKNNPIWVCQEYYKRGLKYCESPIIKEKELYDIFIKIMDKFEMDKKIILDDYLSAMNKNDVNRYKMLRLEKIKQLKDKLLELSIENAISNEEFMERNNAFNKQIEELKDNLSIENKDIIIKKIDNEINNKNFIDIFNLFIKKIYISKINNDRNHIRLEIVFNFYNYKKILIRKINNK